MFIQTQWQQEISGKKIHLIVNMNHLLVITQENFNFLQIRFSIFKSNYIKNKSRVLYASDKRWNKSIAALCAIKEFKLYLKESVRAWVILSKRIPVLG